MPYDCRRCSPDEVIYLALAMQFASFRSVIGTMWAVDDGVTNEITSTFYKHMVDKSGRLDHTRAAFALNKMMKYCGYTIRSMDSLYPSRHLVLVYPRSHLAVHTCYQICYSLFRGECIPCIPVRIGIMDL
jgi:hypothetical protein